MISAHTARRRPVAGSVIIPNRPKSTSATSPGAVSSMRTVVWLPVANSASERSGATTDTPPRCQQLPDAGQLQPVTGEPLVNPAHGCRSCPGVTASPIVASRLNSSAVATSPSRTMPSSWAAATYLAMVSLDKPVPNAILRWLSPACQRRVDLLYFHSGNLPVRHRCTSIPKCGNDRRCGSQRGLMTLKIWWVDPEHFPIHWPIDLNNDSCHPWAGPTTGRAG